MNARVYHYWLEQWKKNVYLIVGASSDELSEFFLAEFGVEWDGDVNETWLGKAISLTTSTNLGRQHKILLAIREFDMTPMALGVLAHECFHAAEFIMDCVGIKHCYATTECFAHTQETIFRLCLTDLMGLGNPKSDVIAEEVTGMHRE